MGIIAVFGGTFNPIHIGHTEIIEYLCKIDNIEKVILIPTKIPPHKDINYLANPTDRLNMCKIVAEDYNKVEVSDIELCREGKSYTIDTVKALKHQYPDNELAITIGSDMLVSFQCWKDYKDILKLCTIIIFKRGGISDADYLSATKHLTLCGAKLFEIKESVTCISSTEIRNELKCDAKTEFLDKRVLNYILENNLFGVNDEI